MSYNKFVIWSMNSLLKMDLMGWLARASRTLMNSNNKYCEVLLMTSLLMYGNRLNYLKSVQSRIWHSKSYFYFIEDSEMFSESEIS
jgi:hypothetical protein